MKYTQIGNMKKISLFISWCIILIPSSSFAIGLGVYTSGSAGSLVHKSGTSTYNLVSNPELYTNLSIGGGIVFDSNISQKYLSYRLNVGVEKLYELQNTHYKNDYHDLTRCNVLNTITIPLIVNDSIKFWIGPQFNLHFISGYYLDDFARIFQDVYILRDGLYFDYDKKNTKFLDLLYSFGVSLGVNINISNNFYLLLEPGFRGGFISQIIHNTKSSSKFEYEGCLLISVCYKIND